MAAAAAVTVCCLGFYDPQEFWIEEQKALKKDTMLQKRSFTPQCLYTDCTATKEVVRASGTQGRTTTKK